MFRCLPFLLALPTLALAQLTPEEAVKRMKLPEGFSARCVAHEPMIRQPLSMSFDDRGRMWVLQYIQYPVPAGLKPVKQDQYLRTIWDKVLEPPPKGPKGADKLTICYDPDENGVFRKSKDFLTGLNLASGFCLGNGGVYVLQSPYLLFYPDKNGDDIPDGDPQVLLTGFGLDDTHSVANSLQWGPDGWLYGAAGSTSTSRIVTPLALGGRGVGGEGEKKENKKDPLTPNPSPARGEGNQIIEFQQGIWRYHPHTKRFELFSEGGGNTFGLDFDKHGQCIAGTNFGGVAMLHHMQGAYYVKGFSKHGPLHNPHAYGYFEHVPYKNFKGGHVTCGGILYEADVYPEEYRGQYIAANLLSNAIHWHKMTPKGASFTAEHGGVLLEGNDSWFRPVDCLLGPDGCVYIADWYDKRAAHLDPIDNWDKTNGRIYKIEYKGKTPGADATRLEKPIEPGRAPSFEPGRVSARSFDLRQKKPAELVELLKHPNMWWRKEARRLLGQMEMERNTITTLTLALVDHSDHELDAMWLLMQDESRVSNTVLEIALESPRDHVRAWAFRIVCENRWNSKVDFRKLTEKYLGRKLTEIEVASVFCSLRQIESPYAHHTLYHAIRHNLYNDDSNLRLLLWWAMETHFLECAKTILDTVWVTPDDELAERVIRRLLACEELPVASDDLKNKGWALCRCRKGVLRAMESVADSTPQKKLILQTLSGISDRDEFEPNQLLRIRAKAGDAASVKRLRESFFDEKQSVPDRLQCLSILGKIPDNAFEVSLIECLRMSNSDTLKIGIVAALELLGPSSTQAALIELFPKASAPVKKHILQALLSRPAWATALFQAYDAGKFPKADLTPDHARTATAFNDKALTSLVEKHFGKVAPATPGEKLARINSLAAMLNREKPGDAAAGKAVFTKNCAACHQLHGEGTKVGPDLTTADRKNRTYLLTQIIDPSGYIRPEFLSFTINTHDGRTLQGMVSEQTADAVTLATWLNGKVEKTAMKKGDIDTMVPSPVSMMPEKLLDTMSEKEIADLLAYLASEPASGGREPPVTEPKTGGLRSPLAKKYKIALISGSLEYKSDDTMPILQKLLEENYPVECVRMFRKADDDIPGLDKLKDCDLAIFFTRRLTIDGDQLKAVKAYCESGKPIIGLRTASHGFQKWLEMDAEVYGGDYKNHYKAGDKCDVTINEKTKEHSILKGVKPYATNASLYKNSKPAADVTILLNGTTPSGTEPVAWTRERKVNEKAQRIFYTSLGHPDDFKEASYLKLVTNAVGWCAKDEATFSK